MAEPDNHPLSTRALQRLRQLVNGNGLAPAAIQLISASEHSYTLNGTMRLEPVSDTRSQQYPGPPQAKRKVLNDVGAMRAAVQERQTTFRQGNAWIRQAITQLSEQPAEGWGQDERRVPLPDLSAIFAAAMPCPACQGRKSLSCPQCNGQGVVICTHCAGQRQEVCYNCSGRGVNPAHPDQPCVVCNGKRYIPCRFCRAMGTLPCPTCHGTRGIACTGCRATGLITSETLVDCAVRTSFHVTGQDLPIGLRRALDRIGMEKLANGHADIEIVSNKKPEPAAEAAPSGMALNAEAAAALAQIRQTEANERAAATAAPEVTEKPEIHYRAVLPYADLQLSFAGKRADIAVFGKKGMLLNVPAFLDEALEPKRKALKRAAQGLPGIEEALEARAMRDTLALQLNGKGKPEELRKLYPLGLSPAVATEMLSDMRSALKNFTRRLRAIVATVAALVSIGALAALFMTPVYATLSEKLPTRWQGLAIGLGLPLLLAFISWAALASAIQMSLQKRFPNQRIPLAQETGKTGITMIAAIFVAYGAILALTPITPWWVLELERMVKH